MTLLGSETEYGLDALDRFRELCEVRSSRFCRDAMLTSLIQGHQLVANVDARDTNLLHLSLFDPADPSSLSSHDASINVSLVRDGLARIDTKSRFRVRRVVSSFRWKLANAVLLCRARTRVWSRL